MLQLIYVAVCVCVAVAVSVRLVARAIRCWAPRSPVTTAARHASGTVPEPKPTSSLGTQEAKPPASDERPKFDVVRLDPEGASVFAGSALAHQLVTILINGREFASARADSDGQWAVVVERSIPSGQVELALIASGPEPGRTDRGQVVFVSVVTPRVASAAHEVRPLPKTAGPLQPKAAESLLGLAHGPPPAALALIGEPGIGKTRLLAEAAARADAHGYLVLRGAHPSSSAISPSGSSSTRSTNTSGGSSRTASMHSTTGPATRSRRSCRR